MNKSLILTALAAALIVAAPAFAQSASKSNGSEASGHINASERLDHANCHALYKQLDQAIAAHANSSQLAFAKQQRQAGENACLDGSYSQGQTMLKSGLKAIGS